MKAIQQDLKSNNLSLIDCFIHREHTGFQVSLDSLHLSTDNQRPNPPASTDCPHLTASQPCVKL